MKNSCVVIIFIGLVRMCVASLHTCGGNYWHMCDTWDSGDEMLDGSVTWWWHPDIGDTRHLRHSLWKYLAHCLQNDFIIPECLTSMYNHLKSTICTVVSLSATYIRVMKIKMFISKFHQQWITIIGHRSIKSLYLFHQIFTVNNPPNNYSSRSYLNSPGFIFP